MVTYFLPWQVYGIQVRATFSSFLCDTSVKSIEKEEKDKLL